MITGSGETKALIDHDNNLVVLLKRYHDVVLGHIITAAGLKADPDKVKAIDGMP